MAEFPAFSPLHVHEHAMGIGTRVKPCWQRAHYKGGRWWTEHFRTCSYCGSIHPADLIEILETEDEAQLVSTSKEGKFLLITPNPIAGQLVEMGSFPGRVFAASNWPQDLKQRLYFDSRGDLPFEPTIGERLQGHFERALYEPAPAMIQWPFYLDHTSERHWPEIWAAANHGEKNAQVQSAQAR